MESSLRIPCCREFATAASRRAWLRGCHSPAPALAVRVVAPRGSTAGPDPDARERRRREKPSDSAPSPPDHAEQAAQTLRALDGSSTAPATPARPLRARSQGIPRPAPAAAPASQTAAVKQRAPAASRQQPETPSTSGGSLPPTPPPTSSTSAAIYPHNALIGAAAGSEPTPSTRPACGLTPDQLEGYQLSASQHRQLEIYLDYLLEINQSMNLTAVRDKGDAWQRHVVDSLALLPVIDSHVGAAAAARPHAGPRAGAGAAQMSNAAVMPSTSGSGGGGGSAPGGDGSGDGLAEGGDDRVHSGKGASSSSGSAGDDGGGGAAPLRVIDVGTGAGLPGMVLAVARPEWKVTLLDSLRKRCDFLREAAARAGLTNVEVVWSRAEDAGHRPELRQVYDLAVARAVAEARVLAELCLPFVRVGGLWVAAKGPDPEDEVAAAAGAIRQLGGAQVALARVDSHSEGGQRTALVVAKTRSSPAKFPRQAGTPNKKPL